MKVCKQKPILFSDAWVSKKKKKWWKFVAYPQWNFFSLIMAVKAYK